MKTLKIFLFLISLIGLASCKKDKEEAVKPDVEAYIQLLKSDRYDAYVLPAFTSQDIEALMQYRNDHTIVTKFPVSGYSSYRVIEPKYKLGVLVLWTIESIRKHPENGMEILGRFPSQHPFITLKEDPTQWIENHENEAYNVVSQAYFDWWENNKNKDFNQARNFDPLESTSYIWH